MLPNWFKAILIALLLCVATPAWPQVGTTVIKDGRAAGQLDVINTTPAGTEYGAVVRCIGCSTEFAEDAPHTTGDRGTMALAVQRTADLAFAGDLDYAPLQLDANGWLKVMVKGGGGTGGTSQTDNTALGTVTAVGYLFDATPPTATDGFVGAARMDANREVMVSELPVAGALADNMANPTTTLVGALMMTWDGTTWDRASAGNIQDEDGSIASGTTGYSSVVGLTYVYESDSAVAAWQRLSTQNIDYDTGAGTETISILGFALPASGGPVVGGTATNPISTNTQQVGGAVVVADACSREQVLHVNISQTGNTQLITGTAAERIYICSLHLVTATAQNIALVNGTGSICGTGTAGVLGFTGATAATGWNLAANTGLVMSGSGHAWGKTTTDAHNVCLLQSGTGQVSGGITYVSHPDL